MSLQAGQCLQNFDLIKKENKLGYYRGKDCIEKLCKKLKEHAMKIINYEEKEMIPLTYEENIEIYNMVYKEEEACNICVETFCTDEDDESYKNRENIPDNIPITTHNATHFMINQLAKEFKGELDCVG